MNQILENMKEIKKYILSVVAILSLVLISCGGTSSSSGSSYRSVNHYHHGGGAWGSPYYGNDVIIIDDGIDVGMPDAIDYPMDSWDY